MKIYAISDLHLNNSTDKPMDIFGYSWENYIEEIEMDWKSRVKDDDIVLIAGDISWAMKLCEAKKDLEYIHSLPGKKIIIKGNHDYWWEGIGKVRNVLPPSIMALQNDYIKIENYVFCGSRGWQTPEQKQIQLESDKKIYDRELIRAEISLQSAQQIINKNDKLVFMIHYPPFNSSYLSSGFTDLFEKYNVNAVVYGHLHGNKIKSKLFQVINDVKYYLSSCDQVNNKLIEIL